MRQAVSPVAILLEREQAHDPRVAFAVNAPLVADDHELLLGIARLAKARKEAPGQDRPGRIKLRWTIAGCCISQRLAQLHKPHRASYRT
jgi:hypothetical protein